jgi:ribonucleotide reductase beta subunit family protein with ferritin-like domain
MGCNCKKNGGEVQVKNVTIVPQTPDELLAQELKEWNGGMPKKLTQEEIDWFNNIDEIKPYEDGEDEDTDSI